MDFHKVSVICIQNSSFRIFENICTMFVVCFLACLLKILETKIPPWGLGTIKDWEKFNKTQWDLKYSRKMLLFFFPYQSVGNTDSKYSRRFNDPVLCYKPNFLQWIWICASQNYHQPFKSSRSQSTDDWIQSAKNAVRIESSFQAETFENNNSSNSAILVSKRIRCLIIKNWIAISRVWMSSLEIVGSQTKYIPKSPQKYVILSLHSSCNNDSVETVTLDPIGKFIPTKWRISHDFISLCDLICSKSEKGIRLIFLFEFC